MAGAASATMEGYLLKRQRGIHKRRHVFALKFEERFFHLSPTSLEYFKGQHKQKRGKFLVEDIKIVEEVKDGVFTDRSLFYFQIGSGKEVMYLAAKTSEERGAWMGALRTAAQQNGNDMLRQYHDGVFSSQKHKWSCCQSPERTSSGCAAATRQSPSASLSLMKTYPPPVNPIGNRAAYRSKTSRKTQTTPQTLQWESVPHNLSLSLDDSSSVSSYESTQSSRSADPSAGDLTQYETVKRGDSMQLTQSSHSADPSAGDLTQYETVRRGGVIRESNCSSLVVHAETSQSQLPLPQNYTFLYPIPKEKEERKFTPMESLHPFEFTPLDTKHFHKAVSTLAWGANDELFVGSSEDCQISVLENLEESGLSQKKDIKISSETTNVDTWGSYLAVGSTVSQIFSKEKEMLLRRMIIAPEDESFKEPSQHLVAFTPTGELATACVDGDEIKLWSPPSRETTIEPVTAYQKRMSIDTGHGSICSLVISPVHEYVQERGIYPCLAVGVNATTDKSTALHLFDWKTQKHQCTLKTGHGGSLLTTFLPTGSAIITGCATSLHIWKPTNGIKLCELINALDSQISSLCCSHDGRHLFAGLENGEVKTFELGTSEDTDGCTVKPIFTFNRLQIPSAATSIAYSRDGRLLAVGHESGILKLWKAPEDDTTAASTDSSHTTSKAKSEEYDDFSGMMFCNEPLLTRMRKIEYYGSEEKYQSTTDGYSIEISKGAFAVGKHVTIQHGVVRYGPFGPFQHHCDLKIVSPIVGFCCSNSNLSMPIKITLPHCINSIYNEDLVCLKARHDKCVFKNGERMFELKEVQDGEVTKNSNSVTLDTNHLCFYCLGIYCRHETEVANFCLIEVMPTHRERKPYQIHYCLCYLLETCREAVDEQYSDGFELRVMRMTFPKREKDPVLKIKFQRNIPGGWTITRRGPSKIYAHEVGFWDLKSTKELVQVHIDKAYPPRFTLEVDGTRATDDSVAEVDFEGINEDRSTEIPLRLPTAELAINAETQTIPTQAHFERPIQESTVQQSPSPTITANYSQQFDNPHLCLPAAPQQFASLAEPVRNGAIPGAT